MTDVDPYYPHIGWLLPRHLTWLRAHGVPMAAIVQPEPVRLARGYRAADGRFEHFPSGPAWLVFLEPEDLIFWRPGTVEMATWNGRSFALGESVIDNAATFALGYPLNVFANPVDWLRAGRDGVVIIAWDRTFDRLRDCPHIAVVNALHAKLEHHLQPPRMPKISVLREMVETRPNHRRSA
ncbi:hypothetical protein [Rhizobium beringeri]|uniref:hypothetical protein n=1 Tax=Rhizobium beringeri TaxID=3019934 RepID=UPI002E13A7BF|nr:hypothetical protein U8P69_02485 [Rhizobium beringeri]